MKRHGQEVCVNCMRKYGKEINLIRVKTQRAISHICKTYHCNCCGYNVQRSERIM